MADLLINAVKDLKDNEKLNRYDPDLCADIHSRLDKSLKENGYGIREREQFAQKNFFVMDKLSQVFPEGLSKCLNDYFKANSLWMPKYDPRFPNQNQTKRCFVNFVDYQRCLKIKGPDCKDCEYFKFASDALCPKAWIEKWNDQLEQGAFPVKI